MALGIMKQANEFGSVLKKRNERNLSLNAKMNTQNDNKEYSKQLKKEKNHRIMR